MSDFLDDIPADVLAHLFAVCREQGTLRVDDDPDGTVRVRGSFVLDVGEELPDAVEDLLEGDE